MASFCSLRMTPRVTFRRVFVWCVGLLRSVDLGASNPIAKNCGKIGGGGIAGNWGKLRGNCGPATKLPEASRTNTSAQEAQNVSVSRPHVSQLQETTLRISMKLEHEPKAAASNLSCRLGIVPHCEKRRSTSPPDVGCVMSTQGGRAKKHLRKNCGKLQKMAGNCESAKVRVSIPAPREVLERL